MSAEREPGRPALEEAVETLRRRGYLGRGGRGGSRGQRATAYAMAAVGLALVLTGLSVGAVLPLRAAPVLATAALLLPVLAAGMGLLWGAVVAAEAVHRRGVSAGVAAAGTGALAAVTALGLAFLAGRPWTAPFVPGPLAGAALAVTGAILVLRGTARAVVLRILRRPLKVAVMPPALWRVTAVTLLVAAIAGAVALAIPTRPGEGERGEPLRVRPRRAHLAVIGVDGPSMQEVRLLAGIDPPLAGVAQWRHAALTEPVPGATLPVRWITVATGVSPERHGVATFRQVAVGRSGPVLLLPPVLRRMVLWWAPLGIVVEQTVPAAHRKVPTVWEMASRGGLAVRVLGWWGSFPPRRVRGVVASERWLLTGDLGPGTVFPAGAAAHLDAVPGTGPLDMDRRALAGLGDLDDPALVMVYLPGWWLEVRRVERGAPLLAARALRPHLEVLGEALERLLDHGFTVCLVGLRPGRAWVMWSAPGGEVPAVSPAELVDTWLDALGLPPAAGIGGGVRRDLSGASGAPVDTPARYGPPPPLAGAAPAGEGAAQLELLKSLGYLN